MSWHCWVRVRVRVRACHPQHAPHIILAGKVHVPSPGKFIPTFIPNSSFQNGADRGLGEDFICLNIKKKSIFYIIQKFYSYSCDVYRKYRCILTWYSIFD
jgi:hypothetical protein